MKSAGAPSHPKEMWLRAAWGNIEAEVTRLQVRIAKATQVGRWGRVKALQHLLTRGTRSLMRLISGLSGMRRESHVRFLGEGEAVTPRPYPTE